LIWALPTPYSERRNFGDQLRIPVRMSWSSKLPVASIEASAWPTPWNM
jgi:hypothetical protein